MLGADDAWDGYGEGGEKESEVYLGGRAGCYEDEEHPLGVGWGCHCERLYMGWMTAVVVVVVVVVVIVLNKWPLSENAILMMQSEL